MSAPELALTRRQLQNRLARRRDQYAQRLIAYLQETLSDRAMARTGVLATLDPVTVDQVIRALVPRIGATAVDVILEVGYAES